jgi:hypothetical protein
MYASGLAFEPTLAGAPTAVTITFRLSMQLQATPHFSIKFILTSQKLLINCF